MQDSGQARHPTVRDKGNEPIVPDDVDTPADDELSSGSSPNLSPAKVARPGRTRDTHIAVHLVTLIMAHSAGQEEKLAESRIDQTKRPRTRLHYP